jgi:hypothetical protein
MRHRRPAPVAVWRFYGASLSVRFTFIEGRLNRYPPSPFERYAGKSREDLLRCLRARFNDSTIRCERVP